MPFPTTMRTKSSSNFFDKSMAAAATASSKVPTLRAIGKDFRARIYGVKEAAAEMGRFTAAIATSGAARLKPLLRSGAARLNHEIAILRQIPSLLLQGSNHHHRGVSIAPRILLLGLLLLQIVVFVGFRAGSSHEQSAPLQSPSLRTLYSVKTAATNFTSVKSEPSFGNFGQGNVEKQRNGVEFERDLDDPAAESLDDSDSGERHAEILESERDLEEQRNADEILEEHVENVEEQRNADEIRVENAEEQRNADEIHGENAEERRNADEIHLENVEEHEIPDEQQKNVENVKEHKNVDQNLQEQHGLPIPELESSKQRGDSGAYSREEQDQQDQEHEEQRQQQDDLRGNMETSILEDDPVCKGGRIFVYDLPPAFNRDLVANCSTLNPWVSLCDALSNHGLGKPMPPPPWYTAASTAQSPWYYTEQFSGELIYHNRIKSHPCVTNDSSTANVFYVPFYAGLDVSRYLWKPSEARDRDSLGRSLVKFLTKSPHWNRCGGCDHFTMIGRITWDFRRAEDKSWGSNLLHMSAMKNMTKLVIESNVWEGGEFGVPYPTSFHPRTQSELRDWQQYLRSRDRDILFSFAGATRRRIPNDFRLLLLDECSKSKSKCAAMDCSEGKCETPEPVLALFLNSTFCLQPRGDSYTRRSIFDAAISGCIPVFFWNQSSYWQYRWFFPDEDESYSVFIDREDVRKGVSVRKTLENIHPRKVENMRNALVDAIPRLVYAAQDHRLPPSDVKDAFDTAIDGVLLTMLKGKIRHQQQQHQKN